MDFHYTYIIMAFGLVLTGHFINLIAFTSLKLYDYVEEGTYIGEVNNNLYLVFSKDNKYLNYEEYIK